MSLADATRFLAGIAEFNQGNFYEAHEEWEAVWLELIGTEKTLCQGLVQIAAGYHKLSLGEVNGARKLLERGLALVRNSDSARLGLPLNDWCARVAADLDTLRRVPFGASADLTLVHPPHLPVHR